MGAQPKTVPQWILMPIKPLREAPMKKQWQQMDLVLLIKAPGRLEMIVLLEASILWGVRMSRFLESRYQFLILQIGFALLSIFASSDKICEGNAKKCCKQAKKESCNHNKRSFWLFFVRR